MQPQPLSYGAMLAELEKCQVGSITCNGISSYGSTFEMVRPCHTTVPAGHATDGTPLDLPHTGVTPLKSI